MTRRAFHSPTAVTSALVLAAAAAAPLASAETDTFTVEPNGKANEVISEIDFDLGEEYRVDFSGSILQQFGEDRCFHDAFYYDCATTPLIEPETGQPGVEARAEGNVAATPLTDYMSAPMPRYNASSYYSVVFDEAEGPLGFQGWPQDNGPPCSPECFGAVSVTITTPDCSPGGNPARRAGGECRYQVEFSFHIDGFPNQPKPSKLPRDLVSTELRTTETKLVSKKKKTGYKGFGTIQMTTTYLDPTLQQIERNVIFALDEQEWEYVKTEGGRRFVQGSTEVTESSDPQCPKGTDVDMQFGGNKGGNVEFLLYPTGKGQECLSNGATWSKNRFKAARLSAKPKRIK